MAAKQVLELPIKLVKGITFRREFTWQSKADNGTISPNPLSGKKVILKITKVLDSDTDFVLDSDSPSANGSSITITDAAAGEFVLVISIADLETFSTKQTKWALLIENPDQTIDEILINQPAEVTSIYG